MGGGGDVMRGIQGERRGEDGYDQDTLCIYMYEMVKE